MRNMIIFELLQRVFLLQGQDTRGYRRASSLPKIYFTMRSFTLLRKTLLHQKFLFSQKLNSTIIPFNIKILRSVYFYTNLCVNTIILLKIEILRDKYFSWSKFFCHKVKYIVYNIL